jgi:regulator of protease activity HflC (stomatin/prohibitin superfamily)
VPDRPNDPDRPTDRGPSDPDRPDPDRPNAFDDEGEPSPLGAPTPLPAGPSDRERRRAANGGRRRRLPVRAGVIVGVIVIVALALIPLVWSSLEKTPRDRFGISYGGGPFEGQHFQKIVQPGSSLFFNGFFDQLYLYPADQQSYIVSRNPGEGDVADDSIVAPSKDRVQVGYQVVTYYKLNSDRLQRFHEQIGLRYSAYTRGGWTQMIRSTFRPQLENALQEQTRRYDVADIFSSEEVLRNLQADVQRAFTAGLETALGDQFFCGPTYRPGGDCPEVTFVIRKIEIPGSVVTAFENNRTSQIEVLTKQNEIQQRAAEAQSIQELASVGVDGEDYVLLKAIESGQIKFWVVPSDSGLTLNTDNPTGDQPAPDEPAPSAP